MLKFSPVAPIVAASAKPGTHLGDLVLLDAAGDSVAAVFAVEGSRIAYVDGNRLLYLEPASPGVHEIMVRALYRHQHRVNVPMAGPVLSLEHIDPSGLGGAAINHQLDEDPSGRFAIIGNLIVPTHVLVTITSTLQTPPQAITIELFEQEAALSNGHMQPRTRRPPRADNSLLKAT